MKLNRNTIKRLVQIWANSWVDVKFYQKLFFQKYLLKEIKIYKTNKNIVKVVHKKLNNEGFYIPKDKGIYREALLRGSWSLDIVECIKKGFETFGNDDIEFIDIGAHCGLTTMQLKRTLLNLGSKFHFNCVEPHPINFEALKLNLQKETDVSIFNYALVSDSVGGGR